MLSDKIQALIIEARELKTSYWNNKAISGLSTALAAAKMNESGNESSWPPKRPLGTATQSTGHISNDDGSHNLGTTCNCPAGGVRKSCPVHGSLNVEYDKDMR